MAIQLMNLVPDPPSRAPFPIANWVSLSLQHRLGLAKLKYQHCRLHGLDFVQDKSDKFSELSDFSRNCYETCLTCTTLRTSSYSQELPRPVPNMHAVTFSPHVMQSARRKRLRSDSDSRLPAKATRLSWKRSHQLTESSPSLELRMANWQHQAPFESEALSPDSFSYTCSGASGEENDPDLPLHRFQMKSPTTNSSQPPPKEAYQTPEGSGLDDTANLLLYAETTPARICQAGGSQKDILPCTPNKYVPLPTLTRDLGSPSQQFNFDDFLNLTPGPAQPVCGRALLRYDELIA
ncbi:unnamed protein product [Penicillium nalgiovense]|nr:unnamed protein product [Penicillium nalgiovense]